MITKSAEDAEREVEASRNELNRTMEELKERMTPGQLFDEASRMMGGAGNQILSKFVEQAKANPMPLAVMGLGVAWLMASNGKGGSASSVSEPRSFAPADAYAPTGAYGMGGPGEPALGERMSGALGDVADKASGAAASARDAMTGAAGQARDAMGQAASGAAHTAKDAAATISMAASGAARQAGQMGQQAKDSLSDLFAREPLLLGGLGLLLGLAVGAALPSTEAEDRLLGEARDRMIDKGQTIAHDKLDDVKGAAQAALSSVQDELKGGDGQTLAEKAGAAVQAGLETVQEQAQTLTH